jgi:hypothetical protein
LYHGLLAMLLRNDDHYREVLEVDVDREPCRRVLTEREVDTPTSGFFFDHEATTFGLVVCRGAIFVLLQNVLIPYEPDLTTQIEEIGERRVFSVSHESETLVRVEYLPMKPFWNFFPIEDEDVDGFLWIHNVLSNSERRVILVDSNSNPSTPGT